MNADSVFFPFYLQIYSVLKSRLPYFSSKAKHVQFKLLQFLIAEIQVMTFCDYSVV